jgi:hypothetical protein
MAPVIFTSPRKIHAPCFGMSIEGQSQHILLVEATMAPIRSFKHSGATMFSCYTHGDQHPVTIQASFLEGCLHQQTSSFTSPSFHQHSALWKWTTLMGLLQWICSRFLRQDIAPFSGPCDEQSLFWQVADSIVTSKVLHMPHAASVLIVNSHWQAQLTIWTSNIYQSL